MNLEHLKKRHFRENTQKFCHDGDCNISASFREICTCGLIHWTYSYVYGGNEDSDKFFAEHYPDYEKDFEKHNIAMGCLRDNIEDHKIKIKKWIDSDQFKQIERDLDEGKFFDNFEKGEYDLKKRGDS